jgi:hypothetical protein
MVIFHSYSRFAVCTLLVLSLAALADTDLAEKPDQGLDTVEKSWHGEIRFSSDVDWASYSKIQLESATVEFRKRWARDLRQRSGIVIKEKDEARIKSDLADLLDEVFKRELSSKAGYVFTDESGADVMRVIPRVVDLDVIAPDRVRDYIGYALTDSQGNMTLELEFYDSLSGDLLATTSQYQEDPIKGYMEWTTSVTNSRAARLMLERWTIWLREWLDERRVGNLLPTKH